MSTGQGATDAHTLLTLEDIQRLAETKVYDGQGDLVSLGDITKGKKTALVFLRHLWCKNCQFYVRYTSEMIPPENLPADTQIIFISCGSWQPINAYISTTASAYPLYCDPSLELYKLLRFNATLSEGNTDGGKRDYMKDAGSRVARVLTGLKGALGHLGDINHVGPKAQNGGEVILGPDGSCEYIYRMQSTIDHTNVSELAGLLGVKFDKRKESLSGATPTQACS